MRQLFQLCLLITFIVSCNTEDEIIAETFDSISVSAVDISSYPEIADSNPVFFDVNGNPKDFLDILKLNGVNTIRLRLWVNPNNEHSDFEEVKTFSQTLKTYGFKIWLTLHYSDTWADPGQQVTPLQWQGISFLTLKDSMYNYTQKVVVEMQPDYIQIGNEINSGLLHPSGNITDNYLQFIDLMDTAIAAVRASSVNTEIIIHYAGIDASDWFFDQVKDLDYDIIGLSYYPIWHGKSFEDLRNKMQFLSETHNKSIVIAETAYPFTLGWNDWTNNIVGTEAQLILPEFPATIQGQVDFIKQIKSTANEVDNCIGFCYWGAELIAWKGPEAADGSVWENQALFNFEQMELPVLQEFKLGK